MQQDENLSLEMRYPQVYRMQGIRYFIKMEDPKVWRIAELEEIDLSVLHYFYPDHRESFGISQDSPFIKGRRKGQVAFHQTQYDNNVMGPVKKKIFNYRLAIKAYHKKNPKVFWARDEKKFSKFVGKRPWNMIVDYSLMGRHMEFRSNPKRHLFFFEARYRGYLNGIREHIKKSTRHQLIMFHVPETLPTVPELKRAAIELKRAYWKIFDSYEKLALLDFWKWLDPYSRKNSLFAQYIPESELDRIDFLCIYNNSAVLLNLGLLDRWVTGKESLGDDSDEPTSEELEEDEDIQITQSTARRFQRRFLKFLSKIVEKDKLNTVDTPPLEIDNNEAKVIQKIYDTNTETSLKDDDFVDPEKIQDNGETIIPDAPIKEDLHVQEEEAEQTTVAVVSEIERKPILGAVPEEPKSEQAIQAVMAHSVPVPHHLISTPHIERDVGVSEPYTPVDSRLIGDDKPVGVKTPKSGIIPSSAYIDQHAKRNIAEFTNELMMTNKQKEYWEKESDTYKKIKSPDKSMTLEEYVNQEVDMTINDKEEVIPDLPLITDKSMLRSTLKEFDQRYIKKCLKRDIARNIVALQKTGIVINNYEVEDVSDLATKAEVHKVTLTPVGGSQSTIRIKVPKIDDDGTMTTGSVKAYMRKQRRDFYLRKLDNDRVSLTSYYGKLFLNRSERRKFNYTKWATAETDIKIAEGLYTDVVYGGLKTDIEEVPRHIQALMTRYRSFTNKEKGYKLDLKEIKKNERLHHITFGNHVTYDYQKNIWLLKGKEINESELFGIDMGNSPDEFAEVKILGELIPVGFILARKHGLSHFVDMLRLPVTKYESGKQFERKPSDLVLRFADEKWVFDKSQLSPRDKLLICGFANYAKYLKNYSVYDFDSKDVYGAILQEEGIAVRYERELDLIDEMFIDDSTREMAIKMNEPTEMTPLYIRAVEIMATSNYRPEINMDDMVIKGYERIAGQVYSTLVNHLRVFKSKPITTKRRFDIPPDDVMIAISKDPSVEIIDDINPLQNMKEKANVTFTGEGGRSKRSMVSRTRSYDDSDLGIISEATVDSSDVAITTFTSASPKFDSLLGTARKEKTSAEETSSIMSSVILTCPFSDYEDKRRTGFSSIQSSHRIPIKGAMPPHVRTGYEYIVAHQVDDKFAYVSKGEGVIKEKGAKYVLISYKDDSLEDEMVEIGVTVASSKGNFYRHDIVCDRDVGYKFKKGEVLVFNQSFFIRDILLPTQVILCDKTYARTLLIEGDDTFEDSSAVSEKFSKQLNSSIVKERLIVLQKTDNVRNMVKLGDEVDVDSPLLFIEDQNFDGSGYFDSNSIDVLRRLSQIAPKAKYHGEVIKIDCFYFCEEDELSPTLKDTVNQIMKYRFSGSKLKLSDKRHMTGKIDKPLRFKSQDIGPGMVAIRVYIEHKLGVDLGDKIVVNLAQIMII